MAWKFARTDLPKTMLKVDKPQLGKGWGLWRTVLIARDQSSSVLDGAILDRRLAESVR
jgi:hypothetical protein